MSPLASSARSFTSKIQQLRNLRLGLAALCATVALSAGILYAPAGKAAVNQMLHRAWPSMTATKASPAPRAAKTAKATATSNLAAAPAGNLNIARQGHAAIRLSDGKILIVGGENANGLIRESEIFNPATHSFITAANLDTARTEHTLARLADGRILVIGGRGQAQPLRTTEIYNYSGNVFTPGPSLNRPRAGHTATALADGRILIAGGSADGSAEIYNPATQTFTVVTGGLRVARSLHGAALLNNGKVLLAGGKLQNGNALNSAELFNPATQSFTAIAKPMGGARVNPVLNKLRNGHVQVIGGGEETMEMFNAVGEYFTAYAHLPNNAATLKTPGRAALFHRKNRNASAETGDATANTAAAVAAPDSTDPLDRDGFTMTDSGSLSLIAGGADGNGTPLNSAEETPASVAAVTTDQTDYAPGQTAIITGTGFLPNQQVILLLERDPATSAPTSWTADTDGDGNFTTSYLVLDTDFGVSFVLTATGQPEGPVAQTTFTDAGPSNPAAQALPYSQDFSALAHTSATFPAGWQGWKLASGSSSAFRTIDPTADENLSASSSASTTGGGVHNYNGKLGILATGSTDPALCLAINTTGSSSVPITFDIMTIRNPYDGGSDTRVNQVDLQYRVGTYPGGAFTSVSGSASGIYQNNTTNQTGSGVTTPQNAQTLTYTLPAACNNQPVVQLRWVQRDVSGSGSRPSFAVDNISVGCASVGAAGSITGSTSVCANATGVAYSISAVSGATSYTWTVPSGATVASGQGTASITVNWGSTSGNVAVTPSNSCATGTSNSLAVTVNTAPSITASPASATKTVGASQTFSVTATGTAPLTYQWRKGGVNIGGATSSSYTISSVVVADAGNYDVVVSNACGSATSTPVAVLTVNQKALTVTGITANNKVYDGNTTATLNTAGATLVGVVSGHTVTLNTGGATGTFDTKNVGTGKTVTVAGLTISGADAGNYTLTQPTTTANITAKSLTVSGITANNKIYDGGITATLNTGGAALVGVVSGDSVTLNTASATGAFANKTVGTGKTVTVSGLTISGTGVGNYALTQPTATADITAKNLTVSGITASNKIYDGGTVATLNTVSAALVGVVGGDAVTLNTGSPAGAFANKNVGTGKTVAVSGLTISGGDAGNYTLTQPTASADITARALTVSATGVNKVYDGAVTATVTLSDDRVAGDALTTSYTSASFANKNVGTGKTVSVSGISISGADAGNYTFNTTATTTANITTLAITVTAVASTKAYDGTTSSSGSPSIAPALVGGDTSGFTQSYDTKHVGTGKTLTPSGSVNDGNSGNNYNVSFTSITTGVITARAITVTAATNTKSYDGTTSAAATPTITVGSLAAGDTANFSESYSTKHVGMGKTLTPSGSVTDGNGGNNYAVTFANDTTGVITARAITVTAATDSKVYDGMAVSGGVPTITAGSLASGDTASFTQVFDSKNAGPRTLTPAGAVSDGNGGNNYAVTYATASGSISTRTLAVTATGVNKVYDGTTAATVSLSDNHVSGDVLTTGYASATFADKNVGTGKTVSVSGITISGTDAGNYSANTATTTTVNITARALTVSATGSNKVYDGTTAATVTLADNRVSGDVLTVAYTSAAFATKSVGTGKTVSVSGITVSGTDSGNYSLGNTTAATTADITARSLTVSATGSNKVYDGTAAASVTLSDNRVSGDVFTASYTSATFADKNVGTGKTVSITGISISGADAGNYTANTTASASADITARTLTVTATGVNKVYDGTTNAAVTLSDNRVSGDVFSASYTSASFADKNVGMGKTVSVSGISISGVEAGNYTANTATTTTANITALAITGSITASNKVYDGTTTATILTRTLAGVVSGDVVSYVGGTANFADKTVGASKTVTATGLSLSGADAGNYTVNSSATTTADITALALTGSITAANKVYDGTTAATILTRTLSGAIGGDVVSYVGGTATFNNKNVGTGKTVTATGLSLSGADAGNYTVNSTATTTANITAATLSVSATASNKTYDGNNTASVTLSDNRVSGDVLTVSFTTATFDNRNVGTGKTVTVNGISISGTDAGNYSLSSTTATTTANITALAIIGGITAANKVYDSTTAATILTRTLTGAIGGDDVSYTGGTATFNNKNVGTGKTVTATGLGLSGADAGNYTVNTSATATADITALALTGSITAASKVYDGNNSAAILTRTLAGVIGGDVVSYTGGTATFADKNVGMGKTVTATGLSLSGGDAGNYTVNATATTTANITARVLTVSATGINKVYDGTTAATITLSDDRVTGDVFTVSYTSAAFADKNVGTGKTVSVTGISISGTDAGNYTFNTTASTTANITQRGLTVTATASNKVYDGNTTATVALADNRVSGDVLTVSYGSATFDTKNIGTGKTVTVSGITISGTDAGNYSVNASTTTTANITALAITGSITASNKVYDGTTAAAIATRTLSGAVSGDVVSYVGGTATFADKNVGIGKTVTATGLSLSGTDAGNYTVNSTAGTTANITAAALTISATGINKVYDGTTAASVTLSDNRIAGDVFTDSYTSAAFANKNVGTGKTVSVSGISISGTDAGNYTFNTTASTTADITARALTVTATASNKVYDGTTTASVMLADNRVSGDVLTVNSGSATFDTKNVGTGKTVTVSGITISSTDAGNYSVNVSTTTTANITALSITGSVTASNKVYDGTAAATIATRTLSGVVSGDSVSYVGGTAAFSDKNVGMGKTVTATGLSLSGTDAGNYTVSTTATTTANITARVLTVSAMGVNKVYDGTTAATVTLVDDRVSGDVFTDSYTSASFADKNVGVSKTVSVTGISISGTDAGNYTFNPSATTTANITARALTVTATGINKVYDATTAATVTLADNRVAGDMLTASYTSATFATKIVGTGKTVSVSGISISGTDAGNYTVNTSTTATADITALAITGSITAASKVYDGTTAATILTKTLTGVLAGDVVTYTGGTATFADKNVGTGKTVTATGLYLSGGDAGNYTVNSMATTTANITARALMVSATGIDKVYDGNTTAMVTLSDNRVSGDVFTASYTSASFADKNVGTGKTVSVSGISISGTDAGNYTFNATASTTANITQRGLTVTATASNKVYDGNTTATVALANNRVSGDVLTVNYGSATFDTKNVGTGKTVTVSGITISGTDAGNYSLGNTTATATANITALYITGSITADNKVYDGTTTATIATRTLSGVVGGDVVSYIGGTATFADKHVGTGKTVTATSLSLSGADAANYTVNSTAMTTANITKRGLTITALTNTKVYDGTTSAAAVPTYSGLQTGDGVTGASETYDNKNAGTGKTLSVAGYTVNDGNNGGNYTVATVPNTNGVITALAITGSVTAANKVYDGNTTATINGRTLTGVLGGDNVSYTGGTATFASKTVATGKTVTATGLSLSGTEAGNYSVNTTATTTADITALAITGSITANSKTYDGTTAATIATRTLAGVVSGDVVSYVGGTATFNNKNVGNGKPVTATGLSLSGTDASNYTVNASAATTADITARALTVTATASNKYYDGTTTASVTLADNRVSGDVLTIGYAAANFADANVGTGKPVTVTGIAISGTDAGNYTVNTTATTTANITARPTIIHYTGSLTSTYGNCTVNVAATLRDGLLLGQPLITANETITITVAGQSVPLTSTTPGLFAGTVNIPNTVNVGSYNIVSTFSGNASAGHGYAASSETLSGAGGFQITPAFVGPYNGGAIYTGLNFFWTTGPSSSTATLTLSATLKDITTPCQGDIRTARVTFATRNADGSYSPISNAQNLPVGLVNPADLTVGTAQAVSQYNLGNQNFAAIQIAVIVTGNYNRNQSADDTIVGIAKPGVANQMIGVGELNNLALPFNSNGFLGNAPATGANHYTSIASNVTYNKSFTNPQGKVNLIVKSYNRSNGTVDTVVHTYSITSNSISTFTSAIVSGQQVVTFGAKCNVVEITNPAAPVTLEGGAQMQIVMSPPGGTNPQTASITIQKNAGGLWYSSAWDGTKTVAKALVSGLISVN